MKYQMIDEIAKELNRQCRDLKENIIIKTIDENTELSNIYHCYKETVFPLESKMEFASLYSQTVVFVLLSASFFDSTQGRDKDLNKIVIDIIHRLKCFNTVFTGILRSIVNIDFPGMLNNFIINIKKKITRCQTGDLKEEDILALVYQRFIMIYDPNLHKKIKYYLTPGPAVSFMVSTIHHFLKEKLNIKDGLANTDIKIMDPASGNGNFLCEALRLALEERTKKYGAGILIDFINEYLSRNIFGSEIMLPLYLMCFINLHKIIKKFCADSRFFEVEKYLDYNWQKEDPLNGIDQKKNTSDEPEFDLFPFPSVPIVHLYLEDTLENSSIGGISLDKKSTWVIFCNPPYSRHSTNKGEQISGLVRDYYMMDNNRIDEKVFKQLHDDYVKFYRFAQYKIDQNGGGVMGFITNNSFLQNPTFRGMRYSLLNTFDEIYILNLHGTGGKAKKKNADDENIFDIRQGIAIVFFCKRKKPGQVKKNFDIDGLKCQVYYSGIKGSKDSKFQILLELKESNFKSWQWERVFPEDEFYLFTPVEKVDIYRHFLSVKDIFPLHGVGIVTARDKLTIKENENEVNETIFNFSTLDETELKKLYRLRDDTRDWQVKDAKKDIIDSGPDVRKIVPILFRPFDLRYTYYTGKSRGFICMPRPGLMRNMLQENIGLVTVRQVPENVFTHCFAADTIIDSRITTNQKGIAYIFPLYKYIFSDENKKTREFDYNKVYPFQGQTRQCNIAPDVYTQLRARFGKDNLPSAEQIFYYIYAVLNSGIYRDRYRDHLKIDFPRIPFTADLELFKKLSSLGEGLAGVHLLKSRELDQIFSKFEVLGEGLIKTPQFKPTARGDGRVYINETQYFSHIPKEIWEFEICGYQVLHKWLNDRENRVLSTLDILHFIKICRAVQLTIKYSEEIDGVYAQLEKRL